jgi:hypothetical protein
MAFILVLLSFLSGGCIGYAIGKYNAYWEQHDTFLAGGYQKKDEEFAKRIETQEKKTAQFFNPVSDREKFDKAEQITDLTDE